MYSLLTDPQTIAFSKAGIVNLHSLKKQIDRRIQKIRTLVMGGTENLNPNKMGSQIGCQTDDFPRKETSNNVKLRHHRVLSSHDSNLPFQPASIQERPSLPNRKKVTNAKQNLVLDAQNSNIRVRVSDYLSSKKGKETILRNLITPPSEDEKEADEPNPSQGDKIFTTVEFQLHRSIKTINSLDDCYSCQFQIPFARNPSSESLIDSLQSDNEGTEGRKSLSTIVRRLASNRKMKITQRTSLPESEVARICASQQCMAKMMENLDKTVGKKRKEMMDNKLRMNVIKKIDERYGEYYHQF